MNTKSVICNYISEHPNTYLEDFEKLGIKVKFSGKYTIFNYNMDADFSSPLVCEARGIIINHETLDVVCIGFNKFFNLHEKYASEINYNDCRVQQKLDGSIIKLWYDNKWTWSTNGMIYAEEAECGDFIHKTFYDLILSAVNYNDIIFDDLNKENTYIFEIVDPLMHPVKYSEVKLYHIGTRNNLTLEEKIEDIGIAKPEEYDLQSLEEVIAFVENLNKDEVTEEGVVVVDNLWRRIKIKNAKYLQLHYLNNDMLMNKKGIIELLHLDDIDITVLIDRFPHYKDVFNFYIAEEKYFEMTVDAFIKEVRKMYDGSNRKEVANKIRVIS